MLGETIAWAAPCVCANGRGIAPNIFGALVATNEEPRKLTFVGHKGQRSVAQTIDLDEFAVAREAKFLSENLTLTPHGSRTAKYRFVFPRSRAQEVESIADALSRSSAEVSADAATLPSLSR